MIMRDGVNWLLGLVLLLIALFANGCAVFSDGATVDYSRFLAPTFQLFGFSGGGSQPWDADSSGKNHKSWQGNEPWSTWTHSSGVEFNHYKQPSGRNVTVTCSTISGIRFCN
jgi:hypothetical protein